MKKIEIESHTHFNQMKFIRETLDGGYCFSYAVLFFSYVSMAKLKNPDQEVNYSALLSVLNNYDRLAKKKLNGLQEHDLQKMLDEKIAILNANEVIATANKFDKFGKKILKEAKNFKQPVYYFIGFNDQKQKAFRFALSHQLCFYISAKNKIHFFDALSGAYILKLPTNLTSDDFCREMIDLMFHKNLLFRMVFTAHSPTLEFDGQRCCPQHFSSLNADQKVIRLELEKFITNPKSNLCEIPEDKFFQTQLDYLKLNIFAIKKQAEKQEAEERKYKYTFR